ncbi:hypothetical protein WOLCODRAFT_146602 [Wolfiporia cocos MD-104 SS10]|uniref:Uncharacterized protein n=1 Tax=Wolfiporia cocos (strain MD-104) TaxID=742152 RepID=A0A2H3JF44_WOLCO|nr:hypothetical protein WOLCODRAFT_146602 [Wolfiporia cocos MD-104 SS10]
MRLMRSEMCCTAKPRETDASAVVVDYQQVLQQLSKGFVIVSRSYQHPDTGGYAAVCGAVASYREALGPRAEANWCRVVVVSLEDQPLVSTNLGVWLSCLIPTARTARMARKVFKASGSQSQIGDSSEEETERPHSPQPAARDFGMLVTQLVKEKKSQGSFAGLRGKAHTESMATFRASAGDSAIGKGNKTKKATKQSSVNDPPSSAASGKKTPTGWFRIQAVRVWTCGLSNDADDTRLLDAKIPSPHVWVERRQYGLVASAENGLMIKRGWGPARMNHFFRTQLPLLFEFLARDHPWITTIDADDDVGILKLELPYIALARVHRHFEVLKVSHPTASDYHGIMARPTASWAESYIYIATRATIESETYLKPPPESPTAVGLGKGKQVSHSYQISLVSEDDEIDKFIENGLHSRSPSPVRHSKRIRKVIMDEAEPDGGDDASATEVATAAIEAAADTTELAAVDADVPAQANVQADLPEQPIVETETANIPLAVIDLTTEEPQVPAGLQGPATPRSDDGNAITRYVNPGSAAVRLVGRHPVQKIVAIRDRTW